MSMPVAHRSVIIDFWGAWLANPMQGVGSTAVLKPTPPKAEHARRLRIAYRLTSLFRVGDTQVFHPLRPSGRREAASSRCW
jgi:hypothetical protein